MIGRLLIGSTIAAATPLAAATIEGNCFGPADDRGLPFQVIQQAPPPQGGDAAYAYHPLTGAATMQLGTLTAAARDGYTGYYFQWANRSNAPLFAANGRRIVRKANLQPSIGRPRKQRTALTSIDRANACTLAQAASVLGDRGAAAGFASAVGVALTDEAKQPDGGDTGPADTCVLAAGALPAGGTGILLDYEVSDGRSERQTVDFLSRFATLVHGAGRKAMLLIDPFDAPSQRFGGISAHTAGTIVGLFDLSTVMLWGGNVQGDVRASYAAQMAMIATGGAIDPRRILIDFDLSDRTSLADAQAAHDMIVRDRLAGVLLWRNGARQGGGCDTPVNAKIAMLVYGRPRT